METTTTKAPMTEWTIHAVAYGEEGIRWGDLRDTLTPTETTVGVVWIAENRLTYMERDCTGMNATDLEKFTGIQSPYLVCVPDVAER